MSCTECFAKLFQKSLDAAKLLKETINSLSFTKYQQRRKCASKKHTARTEKPIPAGLINWVMRSIPRRYHCRVQPHTYLESNMVDTVQDMSPCPSASSVVQVGRPFTKTFNDSHGLTSIHLYVTASSTSDEHYEQFTWFKDLCVFWILKSRNDLPCTFRWL